MQFWNRLKRRSARQRTAVRHNQLGTAARNVSERAQRRDYTHHVSFHSWGQSLYYVLFFTPVNLGYRFGYLKSDFKRRDSLPKPSHQDLGSSMLQRQTVHLHQILFL